MAYLDPCVGVGGKPCVKYASFQYPNAGKPWTAEHDRSIMVLLDVGKRPQDMEEFTGHTYDEIAERLLLLIDQDRRHYNPDARDWTEAEDEKLMDICSRGSTVAHAATLLGRSQGDCKRRKDWLSIKPLAQAAVARKYRQDKFEREYMMTPVPSNSSLSDLAGRMHEEASAKIRHKEAMYAAGYGMVTYPQYGLMPDPSGLRMRDCFCRRPEEAEAIAGNRRRGLPPRHGLEWDEFDDAFLEQYIDSRFERFGPVHRGFDYKDVAGVLGRTAHAVEYRIQELVKQRMADEQRKRWEDPSMSAPRTMGSLSIDSKALLRHWDDGLDVVEICKLKCMQIQHLQPLLSKALQKRIASEPAKPVPVHVPDMELLRYWDAGLGSTWISRATGLAEETVQGHVVKALTRRREAERVTAEGGSELDRQWALQGCIRERAIPTPDTRIIDYADTLMPKGDIDKEVDDYVDKVVFKGVVKDREWARPTVRYLIERWSPKGCGYAFRFCAQQGLRVPLAAIRAWITDCWRGNLRTALDFPGSKGSWHESDVRIAVTYAEIMRDAYEYKYLGKLMDGCPDAASVEFSRNASPSIELWDYTKASDTDMADLTYDLKKVIETGTENLALHRKALAAAQADAEIKIKAYADVVAGYLVRGEELKEKRPEIDIIADQTRTYEKHLRQLQHLAGETVTTTPAVEFLLRDAEDVNRPVKTTVFLVTN